MATIYKSISLTILYVILIELVALWIYIPINLNFEDYDKYYFLIQGFCQLIITLILIYFLNHKKNKITLQKSSWSWYLIAIILGCMNILLQSLLKWLYNILFDTDYYIKYDLDGLPELIDINILSIVLFIPIAEELFFRGYIQNELQQKIKPWIAVIVASFLFALIHAPYLNLIWNDMNLNWHLFYLTFFGGLISGYIFYKSKSIGPSIIFHIFWNLVVTIV